MADCRGLVKAVGKEALVLMTLYSPYMCAGQIAGKEVVDQHIFQKIQIKSIEGWK